MSRTSPNCRVFTLTVQCLLGLLLCVYSTAFAQPPGTFPPAEVVRPQSGAPEPDQLPIKGFYFLDANKNPVLVPGMTYERFTELDSESNRQTRRYIFDQVKITGRVEGNRAQMMVECQLNLESTGGETQVIPLQMGNFHRISPPEFLDGSDSEGTLAITIDDATGGYLLLASSQTDKKIAFRMQMSARVEAGSASVMQFDLPTAPVFVELTSDARDARGEIINRNDEVLQTVQDKNGRSKFLVESGGGKFTLRWGAIEQSESVPLLEASTKLTMRWNSPQDQPIQTVQLVVRDLRESIERFRLRLPENAVLLDAPVLANSGQALDLIKPDEEKDPQLYEVVIPKEEQRQRIDLNLELHIPLDAPATSREFVVRVPEVVGALRHQGTLEIQTGNDYRLRWRDRPYVQMESRSDREEQASETREYVFRFSRGSFTLPLWMGATKRQLRVTSRSNLELSDNYVNLTMEIQPVGNERGSQVIAVDLADWESPQVTSALTGTPLTWHEAEDLIEIEAVSGGMDELTPILIRARRSLDLPADLETRRLKLAIPRVVASKDESAPIVIQESEIQLIGKGRSTVVVDLEDSPNIERSISTLSTENQRVRRFRVMPPDASAVLSGVVVEEPPRLVLESLARVLLVDRSLETIVDWELESQVDLRGRVQVLISEAKGTPPSQWKTTVNGKNAVLLAVDDIESDDSAASADDSEAPSAEARLQRFELISDELASGLMRVRFESSLPLGEMAPGNEILSTVGLPVPGVEDVSLKSDARVELVGDSAWALSTTDLDASEDMAFSELPALIPVRLTRRAATQGELTVQRMLIRSAVSEATQHDQVIVVTEGAGDFRLRLREPDVTELRVYLNDERVALEFEGDQIRVPLSGSDISVLDIQLWSPIQPARHYASVTPLILPSREINRLEWDVTVPSDRHLIWASPSASRSMRWVFDGWRMVREPLYSETELINRVATIEPSPMPAGNRYQFSAMDGRSLRVRTTSMTAMWMVVAATVLLAGCMLSYFRVLRHPFSLIVLLLGLSGVACFAPDAAIIAGQVGMGGGLLIGVMLALRALVRPLPSRVLESTMDLERDPSTRIVGSRRDDSRSKKQIPREAVLEHTSSEVL